MSQSRNKRIVAGQRSLPKCLTGIQGLDEITGGGLPQGRPTLICGSAGSGKTLLGMEFLVSGALQYGEPGVCLTFEETAEEMTRNVASLGFDVDELTKAKKLIIDYIQVDRSQIYETGEYDLEGLFVRLASAIDAIGAKRVVLDTIESLFAGLTDEGILRAELRRLFRWLKDKGVTAVITGERGEGSLTRHGLEEYVSDCVILLDQRSEEGIVTRRLRIVKYRGSSHGANEYPFLIDEKGISVLPLTSLGLDHPASSERISTGVSGLDEMLGGQGYFRGSSILASGPAGTGKTSLAAHFVDAACRRGESSLYLAFEESSAQLIRNMRSIGLDLAPWLKKKLLHIHATRPSLYGLEMHLVQIHRLVRDLQPRVVVIDPITSLIGSGAQREVKSMLLRIIDFLKQNQITAFFTALTAGTEPLEGTELDVSSLVDAWLLLRDVESQGEHNRILYVLKSRGMAHSNQVREFTLTPDGVRLRAAYLGTGGVLTGSARLSQEEMERQAELAREQHRERQLQESRQKKHSLQANIQKLQFDLEQEEVRAAELELQEELRRKSSDEQRDAMARSRHMLRGDGNRTGGGRS